ncbi:MAG: amino acid--tRNA ligase-related protein [Pyrinomonadaceae bacterium]
MNIPQFDEIIEQNDQTAARLQHLEAMRELVGNVYTNKFARSAITGTEDTITNILKHEPIVEIVDEIKAVVAKLAERERPPAELKDALNARLKEFGNMRIAGRLTTPPRGNFVHLTDGISKLQIYAKKATFALVKNDAENSLDEENGWTAFGLLDHGDFIGVEGYLFITNTGELSVHVEKLQFLAKAMLPMPDKMHGIADPEIRRRYRYVDLIGSSLQVEHEGLTTREIFERRAKIISSMRRYLEDHGYIEVETPMLTPKATGAAAEPFETYHKALDIPLFARIAPELYLKRLMVGGFEKVFELNRNFRNEGLSHKHNPEFTMLEFYCAYMDVNGMMDFCEELLFDGVVKANGGPVVSLSHWKEAGPKIDFSRPWPRLTMTEAILESGLVSAYANEGGPEITAEFLEFRDNLERLFYFHEWLRGADNPTAPSGEDVRKAWEASKRPKGTSQSKALMAALIADAFEKIAESEIGILKPTFIVDYPKDISPLAKASPENPQIAERFELFINGMEVANGFSELNDPKEQYDRFVDQMKVRESGDAGAMVLDEDYIRALSYGMPPAAGIGIGIDRIVMLLTNQHSIRDVILFPHMRPEKRDGEKGSGGEEE